MEDSYDLVFGNKQRVLVIFAHPDDLEIFCGGTVARLVADGKMVRTIALTNGDKGTRHQEFDSKTFAEIRLRSQICGELALGVQRDQIFNLEIGDGNVEDTVENIEKVVRHIREFRPDIIITHEPTQFVHGFDDEIIWINHRDHRKTAGLVFDAVYPYSRDRAFFPQHAEEGLTGHEVHEILFSDAYKHKTAIGINVKDYLDKKRKALECHQEGNVFSEEEIEGYMTEGESANGWFEILGWWKGFH